MLWLRDNHTEADIITVFLGEQKLKWRVFHANCSVTWLFSVYNYNQISHVVSQTFLSEKSRIKHKKVLVLQTHCQDFSKLLTPRMLENKTQVTFAHPLFPDRGDAEVPTWQESYHTDQQEAWCLNWFFFFFLNTRVLSSWQWVKCLLGKHGSLSLDPHSHVKPHTGACAYNPSVGGGKGKGQTQVYQGLTLISQPSQNGEVRVNE